MENTHKTQAKMSLRMAHGMKIQAKKRVNNQGLEMKNQAKKKMFQAWILQAKKAWKGENVNHQLKLMNHQVKLQNHHMEYQEEGLEQSQKAKWAHQRREASCPPTCRK